MLQGGIMRISFQHFFLQGKRFNRSITRGKPKGEFALMLRAAMGN
jgi:hypothetical protein